MKITRRDFIHAGCGLAAAALSPSPSRAWFRHGSAVSNPNRVTINAIGAYANFAKGINWSGLTPVNTDANGYPTGTLGTNSGGNPSFESGYYGDYVWKWSGTGSMQIAEGTLVRATYLNGVLTNGVVTGLAGSSGDVGGNTTVADKADAKIVFAFGALIQSMSDSSISNGSGGNYIKITFKTGYVNNFAGEGTLNNITIQDSSLNGNIVGQRNAIGLWNYVKIDGNSIYLTSLVSTGAVSSYNASDLWSSGGEAILPAVNIATYLLAGTFTNFTDLVFCTSGNETYVDGGGIWDPALVSQLQYLFNHSNAALANRGWLRFMDLSGVQTSYECDFASRMPVTCINYNPSYFPPAYWLSAGFSTSDGASFTCNSGRTGAYQDLEIVQGTFGATSNSHPLPILNDNSRGAAPIFDFTTNPIIFSFSGPPLSPGTDVLKWTFSATWLNGGTPYVFSYPTVVGDTSVSALNGHLVTALVADSILSAGLVRFTNSGQVVAYPRTAEDGALTITYTSGPAICTMTRIPPSTFAANGTATFIYSKILGGWIYRSGGLTVSIPAEAIVDLCNRVGAHCWYNWPVYTKAQYITDLTNFLADGTTGLTAGLRFGAEVGNEVWNFSQQPFGRTQYLGWAMGFGTGGEEPQWSWTALRMIQYASLSQAAWTGKGRVLSDHYILQMGRQSEAFPNQNFQSNGLNGASLTTSNSVYAAYSGLTGGLGPADYSISGNRPADKYSTAIGFASYWFSDYIREQASEIYGAVADNAAWLQAAKDYGNGLTAQAFSALATLFNARRGSAPIASGTYNNSTGQVVLTLASIINAGTLAVGDLVYPFNLTGSGALSSLDGNGYTSVATTSGTTVTFNATAGLGVMTITGGTLVDRTAANLDPNQAPNWPQFAVYFDNFESIAEGYDTMRATNGLAKLGILHYEGAPQWGFSSSVNNGTNSLSDSTSTLSARITALVWDVSAYTLSGTNSASEMAQMVVNMTQGWKLDMAGLSPTSNGTPANTGSYKGMIKISYYQALVNASAGSGREVKPAQYGYQANTWGLFPVNYALGGQYTSYDAIHEVNAGG